MTEYAPPSHPIKWRVDLREPIKHQDGWIVCTEVTVTAQTAHKAWRLAAPQLPGDPAFNQCRYETEE